MIDWAVETLIATSLLMVAVLLLRNPVARLFVGSRLRGFIRKRVTGER